MCTIGPLDHSQLGSQEKSDRESLLLQLKELRAANSNLADRLLQSETRFREMLEGASDAVFEISQDGKIQFANSASLVMFQFGKDEVIGQEVETLFVPEGKQEAHRHHRQKYIQHPRIRRMGSGLELSARRKDGAVFPVEISLIPIWSTGDAGVVAIVHDITRRKRMEEKLRQAQKLEALGRLAGGTAHEFNNLMAIIMGSAELILTAADLSDLVVRNAERIKRAAGRGGGLSRQLLAFGRRQILSSQILDLNAVVMEASLAFTELLGDEMEFEVVPAQSPVWVSADRLLIEQVINNLVSNARNAMRIPGKVRLSVAEVEFTRDSSRPNPGLALGHYALLSIADTGVGMTPEIKARLFEPFFSTRGIAEATGMGLAASYGIITQSGGTISVESQPNEGTTFNLFLPIPDQEVVTRALAHAPARNDFRGNETILLLEDQPDLLMLTGEFLRQSGYRVLSANHPDEALRIGTTYPETIDLLITDILMPGMDGREFAKKIKEIRPKLPVLYVSGYTADILEQLDGDEAFMSKPFAVEELAVKIREMLSST